MIIKFVVRIDMEIHVSSSNDEYVILGTGWAWWQNL